MNRQRLRQGDDEKRLKPRSNRDFWIPAEGIEREVITYEITRYLGEDALVRPGRNPEGQEGYLITSFRAPSLKMIRSMKEASEKFVRESSVTHRETLAHHRSKTLTGRDRDLGRSGNREQESQSHRRGGFDSGDIMDDAPPSGRAWGRDYNFREGGIRPEEGQFHDPSEDPQEVHDPRYQAWKEHHSDKDTDDALSHETNPFIRPGVLQDLPILIGTTSQKAFLSIPDTGSTLNILNHHFLKDMPPSDFANMVTGMSPDTEVLEMANGSTMSTLGQVTMSCAFLDRPESVMEIIFHVCRSLAGNVQIVLGKKFLETTKTLTTLSHRLIERPMVIARLPRVMSMSSESSLMRPHMQISLNQISTLAYPDTGSEIDLVSTDYVRRLRHDILRLERDDPQRVHFADGVHQKLLGKIIVRVSIPKLYKSDEKDVLLSEASWEESQDSDVNVDEETNLDDLEVQASSQMPKLSQERAFFIMDRLHCDVVLGQAFLHSVNAFKIHKHAFRNSDPVHFCNTLNGIFVLKDWQNKLIKLWGKYARRRKCLTRLPATEAELNQELFHIDRCYSAEEERVTDKITQLKKKMHETASEHERIQYKLMFAELEVKLARAQIKYQEDIKKVRDGFTVTMTKNLV